MESHLSQMAAMRQEQQEGSSGLTTFNDGGSFITTSIKMKCQDN